jgi:hypothetical protein
MDFRDSSKNMNDIFKLLKDLIVYINHIYKSAGLEVLVKQTNPSIDDLQKVLDEIQNKLEPTQLNAVQAVIFTKLLLNEIQHSDESDEHSLDEQFKLLIASLNTINEKEFLV